MSESSIIFFKEIKFKIFSGIKYLWIYEFFSNNYILDEILYDLFIIFITLIGKSL